MKYSYTCPHAELTKQRRDLQGFYFVIENNCYLEPEREGEPTLSLYFEMDEPAFTSVDDNTTDTFENS